MKIIKNLSIYFFIFVFFLLLFEWSCRFLIPYKSGVEDAKFWYEYRLQDPAAYNNAEYNVKTLVKENFSIQHIILNGNLVPKDQKGKYINVRDNKRVTLNQPEKYINNIHVFGGSTIFCAEVPDEFTIASILQKIINQNLPNKFKVINHGTSGLRISDQVQKIKYLNLKPNDILIFYDGVNEVYQNLFRGSFDESIIEQDRNFKKKLNIFHRLYIDFFDKFAGRHFFLFRRFLNPYQAPQENIVNITDENILSYNDEFIDNLEKIKSIAYEKELIYFHIFQPNLFIKKNKSKYQKKLLNNKWLTPSGLDKAFDYALKEQKLLNHKLEQKNINSFSLIEVFDDLEQEIYLDYYHLNEYGNSIIAKNIYKIIFN